jgi:hypothetical protein
MSCASNEVGDSLRKATSASRSDQSWDGTDHQRVWFAVTRVFPASHHRGAALSHYRLLALLIL